MGKADEVGGRQWAVDSRKSREGGKLANMGLLELELMLEGNLRPQPGLLPQEKGNIFPLLVGLIALAIIQSVMEPQ